MPTYRLDLAYDGSGFHGYARQPAVRTVQGVLEEALFVHTGELDTHVAGRTDKGVHAEGQVVSFSTEAELETEYLLRSLNRQLGPAVAALRLRVAPEDFHARFSATARRYRYRILNRETPDPFLASTSWHYEKQLDVTAMNAGIQVLVGEHDFAAFCRKSNRPTTRQVRAATWSRHGDLVELDITARSFCHQMVRSIVAASVDIGRGLLPTDAIGTLLASRDRTLGRGAAPARGLTVVEVEYG